MDGAGSGSVTLKTLSCANTTKKLGKEVTEEVITSFSSIHLQPTKMSCIGLEEELVCKFLVT